MIRVTLKSFLKSLAIRESVLDKDHPHTVATRKKIALVEGKRLGKQEMWSRDDNLYQTLWVRRRLYWFLFRLSSGLTDSHLEYGLPQIGPRRYRFANGGAYPGPGLIHDKLAEPSAQPRSHSDLWSGTANCLTREIVGEIRSKPEDNYLLSIHPSISSSGRNKRIQFNLHDRATVSLTPRGSDVVDCSICLHPITPRCPIW
jgi:hypothetical protein